MTDHIAIARTPSGKGLRSKKAKAHKRGERSDTQRGYIHAQRSQ